jgi:hypothetical protein
LAAVGAVMGSYHPYPRNPYGWKYPVAYLTELKWHEDTEVGALGGAGVGLAFGILLLFVTEPSSVEKIRNEFRKGSKKSDK